MKEEVPPPPEALPIIKDERQKFLEQWAKLFEGISDQTIAIIKTEDNKHHFSEIFELLTSDVDLSSYYTKPQIIIQLLSELGDELGGYLIGIEGGKMFSEKSVLSDLLYQQNKEAYSCEPETETWEYYYNLLHKISVDKTKEIPEPPKGPIN